jgi:hypothetical protein
LQSFVSKYLHFHCELVPIFDSRAEASIGDWESVYRIRDAIGRPPDWLTPYYNFATAFVALSERIVAETGAGATSRRLTTCSGRPSSSDPLVGAAERQASRASPLPKLIFQAENPLFLMYQLGAGSE